MVKVNKENFLGEIPIHYLYTIIEGNFGLKPYEEEFKLYKPPIKFKQANVYTKQSVMETKAWLKERLRKQGMKDSIFVLRYYSNTYNLQTKSIESKKILYEEEYDLN